MIYNMIRFLRAVLYLLFAAAIAWLATSNVQPIEFTYSPAHDPLEIPAYMLGLGGVGLGFVFGCFMVWIHSFGQYLTVKKQKKQIKKLQSELDKLEKENQEHRQHAEPYVDTPEYIAQRRTWEDDE